LDPPFDNEICSSRYGAGICRGFWHGGHRCSAEAEPEVKDGEGEEGAEGVEKGIIGRVSRQTAAHPGIRSLCFYPYLINFRALRPGRAGPFVFA